MPPAAPDRARLEAVAVKRHLAFVGPPFAPASAPWRTATPDVVAGAWSDGPGSLR